MSDLREKALEYHSKPRPGKVSVEISKPANTAKDFSLAYSPGVAEPVKEIAANPQTVYNYTIKGNLVAVISNGTAILGLGNLGALASKPVMEGKGLLFKKCAGIDVFDIEVDTTDPKSFIETVRNISVTFGGINLEDIKSPECFEIEQKLIELCDIPVFHDDQHGTAIVTGAGMLNAMEIVGKKLSDIQIVCMGAGAAASSCMKLLISLGANPENIIMLDSKGVLHTERKDLNPQKAEFARNTKKRTLSDAIKGADAFIGLSSANLLTPEDLKTMAKDPIVFACANPNPEIMPDLAKEARSDVIIATGRSDFPNQVNNVLGFPYIFRGALDVRAKRINEDMKLAAVRAIAELAKEPVPAEVCEAYGVDKIEFGKDYIIPKPSDKRLITFVSDAVAKAAIASGVATFPYPKNYPLKSKEDIFNV